MRFFDRFTKKWQRLKDLNSEQFIGKIVAIEIA